MHIGNIHLITHGTFEQAIIKFYDKMQLGGMATI